MIGSRKLELSNEQGILTDWDTEKAVWDNLFSPECLDVGLTPHKQTRIA